VAIQNHDQVGNRAAGERLSTLVDAARLRLAAALLLLSPYVPLIFMGEEYGETNPFQYFIDHGDSGLVAAVREGRQKEFESFGWSAGVPDPHAPETFGRSKLEWDKAARGDHARIRALYADLLALRQLTPELRPDGGTVKVFDGPPGWISVVRGSVWALFNCSNSAAAVPFPESGPRAWTLRLTTDAPGYAATAESAVRVADASVHLPAWTAAVFTNAN
jgi:maltooligosyltrehalose trehalohydrolase